LSTPSNLFSIKYRAKGQGLIAKVAGFDCIQVNAIKGRLYGHTGNIENYHSIYYYRSETPMGLLVMINTSGAKKTPENLVHNRLHNSLNYFASRGKVNTRFYKWPKKYKK